MAYKTRSPIARPNVASTPVRGVLRLTGECNMTTQNLGKPRKNTTGAQ